jgi:hypothetical protein
LHRLANPRICAALSANDQQLRSLSWVGWKE